MTPDELKRLQAELGLTNAELAQAIGVSESTIVKLRAGQHGIRKPIAIAIRALQFGGVA